jgi:hypothetical protein
MTIISKVLRSSDSNAIAGLQNKIVRASLAAIAPFLIFHELFEKRTCS